MRKVHLLVIAIMSNVAPVAGAVQPCASLTKFTMPGHGVVIRKAQEMAASAAGV